jgi:hypothetical protein
MTTIQEQISIINAAIANEPDLAGLSSSQVAEWVAIRNVVAAQHTTLRDYFTSYKLELEQKASEAIPGTARWYADRAVEFQYGDSLQVVDGKVVYPVIDESARVVKYAAITEGLSGTVVIKVAKGNDVLEKLSNDELVAFTAYIRDIKFAGTKTNIISTDADLIRLNATIYYDGKRVLSEVKAAVEAAINEHLRTVFFDGIFNRNILRDAIESVDSVRAGGVDITNLQIKPNAGTYVAVPYSYVPFSGYYNIDPAFPLSTQLTYIPA